MKVLKVDDLLPYGLMYSENGARHQEVLDHATQAHEHFQRVYRSIQAVLSDDLIDILDHIEEDLSEIRRLAHGNQGDSQGYTRSLYSALLDYFAQKELLTNYLNEHAVYVA